MARREIACTLGVLAAAAMLAATAAASLNDVLAVEAPSGVTFHVIESNDQHTLIEVLFPEATLRHTTVGSHAYDAVEMPGTGPYGAPGDPSVAVAATFIAIPPTSGVELRILEETHGTWTNIDLKPVQAPGTAAGDQPLVNSLVYSADRFFPETVASVGEPAIMRDFRVVPLRTYPIRYNPTAKELSVTSRLLVELYYGSPGRVNLKTRERPHSRSYRRLYEALIANYDFVKTRHEDDERGKYLIITHDDYYDSILPLAEWKHRRGVEVEIARLSVIGSSAAEIKAYIQNAYDNWTVPPEYVLLVGDTEYLPTSGYTDDYYAKLEGADYLVDVDLGRLSCDNVTQCELIVAKTLGYEKTPDMSDPDWFRSACLIVRDDYDSDDAIYYDDTWHAYDLMTAAGFVQIDTLFRRNGSDKNDVHAAVTDGRVLVNYRGQGVSNWWSPFDCDPNLTNPGYKLPVVMSATCGTGSFYSDGYPCETWMRAGTVAAPKGAVAFVATSEITTGHADWRSPVNQGFYSALFYERLYTVTAALNYGKYRFWGMYGVQSEYEGWNTQGDPELDIWTMTPETLTVTHPSTVPVGPSNLVVEVEAGGNPVDEALVCAYLEGEVYSVGETDPSGQVSLPIDPSSADTLWITVTGHNLHPYEGYAIVTPSGPFLIYATHTTDDSSTGNNDGLVSPGETIELTVSLENAGPDDAYAVTGALTSDDPYVTLVDTTATYGDIPSGDVVGNSDPYVFTVDENCPNGEALDFDLVASDSSRTTWTIVVPGIEVSAADLAVAGAVVDDSGSGGNGNGTLEAGETAWVTVTLENGGPIGLDDVSGVLSTGDPYVAVTDADGYFGTIAGNGGSATSTDNAFRVSVSPNAPPAHEVSLTVTATGNGPTYQHVEDAGFTLTLGGTATEGPCGPDAYGYYAYDTTDTWSGQAPTYDWIELVGVGSKIAAITDQDAATTTLSLPFTFKYYGVSYGEVSVCSNGFLAMGVEDYRFGDNSQIPSAHGPAAMIAPFWDDLDPSYSGDIYEWYDDANHCFVVQFDACVHYGGSNPETFEVILYDPAYYTTATGDGVILIQYQTVSYIWTATAGIESPAQDDGIQYVYNGTYDSAAAPITSGQAIKYTTEPPNAPPIWLAVEGTKVDDTSGGNGDGEAQPYETVDLVLTIDNLGTSTAPSVTAAITTVDPDVTIVDGEAAFGDIPGSGSADNGGSPFTVTIGPDPDSEYVEFDVHIATGSRYDTWDVMTLVLDLSGTGIDGGKPIAFSLKQNYPNPFRAGTSIVFDLPQPSHVRLDVYNVAGRRIATVADRDFGSGRHAVAWNGVDSAGRSVPAGIYFYKIDTGSRAATKKMIVVK